MISPRKQTLPTEDQDKQTPFNGSFKLELKPASQHPPFPLYFGIAAESQHPIYSVFNTNAVLTLLNSGLHTLTSETLSARERFFAILVDVGFGTTRVVLFSYE